ncbi:hypothetical protein [Schleiferilactobacillus perolens]|uniref:Uncharacterized protein n=1 Tax=Schleiferilactobacillus perolens DSM 12744 TaxID=1423792 RepID=A0A0R1MSA4_9LACO|nr:hypothetical protein [Schleiferilactobacillus perolens]KRL07882.1 hypothetical protein FD09_GL002024 [Schleiferilactobacillus perolens DSM 12744]
MTKSATAMVLEALPGILDTKEGQTFPQIWERLIQIKELEPMLVNDKKQPRFGVLQGISTRVKAGKVLGIVIIKDAHGAKWFKTDSGMALYVQEAKKNFQLIRDLPPPPNAGKPDIAAKQLIDKYLDQVEEQFVSLGKAKPAPAKSTKSTTVKAEEKKAAKA